MPSLFSCSPVIREWSWKKTPIEKKNATQSYLSLVIKIYLTFGCKSLKVSKTDSTNNLKRLPKKTFLQQHKFIVDANLMGKTVQLKNGSKVMYMAHKMIYIESIWKLCNECNTECACISYYFLQLQAVLLCAAKRERKTKLCVHQLPKHLYLLLQAINQYRTSIHLKSHDSLTIYLQELKSGNKLDELNEKIYYTYHKYERVI